MANLVVLIFDDMEQAGQAFHALRKAGSDGYVKIDDSAVIVKNADGKVEVKNQMDTGVKWGAVGGGALGLMLAGIFFPLAGLALGALAGGLLGKMAHLGVDKQFVKEVTEKLQPGSSALFIIGSGNPDVIAANLRPFHGTVYHTNVSEDALEALQDALKKD
jgi:uncharacterized membrane protein